MSARGDDMSCECVELAAIHAVGALPADEAARFEAHAASCTACTRALEEARSVTDHLAAWPADGLPTSASLQERLARRIADESGGALVPPPPPAWSEPEWREVAPGISCKILSHDPERDRVSMLVRLAPGTSYPAHTHAGREELHLLDGELRIDDRLLYPGDYNFGSPGASDQRVYSETGCTCVLITSPSDKLY